VYVSSTRIVFSGQSSLPEGSCLHTQLLADREPVTWWPDETCATVDADGAWEIAVELGAADAPTRSDPTLYYVLRAWCPDNPSSPVQFWFDLAGPPAPYSSAPSPTTKPAQRSQAHSTESPGLHHPRRGQDDTHPNGSPLRQRHTDKTSPPPPSCPRRKPRAHDARSDGRSLPKLSR
jgi:hypothetical protein